MWLVMTMLQFSVLVKVITVLPPLLMQYCLPSSLSSSGDLQQPGVSDAAFAPLEPIWLSYFTLCIGLLQHEQLQVCCFEQFILSYIRLKSIVQNTLNSFLLLLFLLSNPFPFADGEGDIDQAAVCSESLRRPSRPHRPARALAVGTRLHVDITRSILIHIFFIIVFCALLCSRILLLSLRS